MKFYFPDSQDLISPAYDFIHDEYPSFRVRQRDDRYAHEVLQSPPYDGLLVSKAIVDGSVRGAGKYSASQRERLYRLGVRRFFRLPPGVTTMGDCGAFNYIGEYLPPYTVNEVLDFYEGCGFDSGVSIDHVIFGYDRDLVENRADVEWRRRRRLSLDFAQDFIMTSAARGDRIEPIGAAQGWSPATYADSVRELQDMGYKKIALGGMVPLKSKDIIDCLKAIKKHRKPDVGLHLLGINRVESMAEFAQLGVSSFDSTSPFRQSFMDDRDNYHTTTDKYAAIRVPQVDGNVGLKRRILAGQVPQRDAVLGERDCLNKLRALDRGEVSVDTVLDALITYESLITVKRSYLDQYRRTLEAEPWKYCPCSLCKEHGVEMIIFRGTERNKRRGFHNLSVLESKLRDRNLTSK